MAYRPRAGSAQRAMYDLLTRPEGVTAEKFVETMNPISRGKWTLDAIWSPLVYLFVSQKGYGLDFDGQVFRLLVPATENEATADKKKKVA